jgi:hypothetical protein
MERANSTALTRTAPQARLAGGVKERNELRFISDWEARPVSSDLHNSSVKAYLLAFVLVFASVLGYSEFYGTAIRAVAFIYVIVLVRYKLLSGRAGNTRSYLLMVFYSYFVANPFILYMDGRLPVFRFVYVLLFPLSVYGAYLLGSQLGRQKVCIGLFLSLLLLFSVGAYQLFSPVYATQLMYEQALFSPPQIISVGDIPWNLRRVSSLVGNANAFGALMCFIMLFNLHSRKRLLKYGSAVLAFVGIFFMAKGLSSMLTALFVILLYLWFRKKRLSFLMLLPCLGMVVTVIAYVLSGEDFSGFLRFSEGEWVSHSYYGRIDINVDAVRVWINNFNYLLFGSGFDCETIALERSGIFAIYTESFYVKVMLELGLLGVFMMVALVASSWRELVNQARLNGTEDVLIVSAAVWLFYGIMETAAMMPSVALPIAIMFGSMLSRRQTIAFAENPG